MSSLVLMVAVTAAPGIGPEMVSAETEQGLDMRGEWAGCWYSDGGAKRYFEIFESQMFVHSRGLEGPIPFEVTDEGRQKFRLEFPTAGVAYVGIYRHGTNCLMLCLGERRPTSFAGGGGQELFILCRVRPRK